MIRKMRMGLCHFGILITISIMHRGTKRNTSKFILHEERRGDCYRFLAACFYLPQKDLFAQEDLFENLRKSLEPVCPEAARLSIGMREAFLRSSDDDLSAEYARLFVGPYKLRAPPYGSVYLDKGRRVMGDSTMEVMSFYREEGLSIDDAFKELPDHICAELEFMYYLIHKELEALNNSDTNKALEYKEKQDLFLNRFLRRWVPLFCEETREGTNSEFYRVLVDCLLTFIRSSEVPENFTEFIERRTIVP